MAGGGPQEGRAEQGDEREREGGRQKAGQLFFFPLSMDPSLFLHRPVLSPLVSQDLTPVHSHSLFTSRVSRHDKKTSNWERRKK